MKSHPNGVCLVQYWTCQTDSRTYQPSSLMCFLCFLLQRHSSCPDNTCSVAFWHPENQRDYQNHAFSPNSCNRDPNDRIGRKWKMPWTQWLKLQVITHYMSHSKKPEMFRWSLAQNILHFSNTLQSGPNCVLILQPPTINCHYSYRPAITLITSHKQHTVIMSTSKTIIEWWVS